MTIHQLIATFLVMTTGLVLAQAEGELGSKQNPVRAFMPSGEREYLTRLRCPNCEEPKYERLGSFGDGPYGNILDGYQLTCENESNKNVVYMDMYHREYRELAPVPGYTILADLNDNCTTNGSSTQMDIDKAIEPGKQTCISNPASCGITTFDNSIPTTNNCMADYSATGQFHVPCVSVFDQLGGKTIYDVILNQQTGAFTFDLDMDSVKPMSVSADSLTLYAAGSLKAALGDVAVSYGETYKMEVNTKFGPSGLLRQAIEEGENPDVFASANMAHPEKLASNEWGSPVVLFARNKLCALTQPDVEVSTDNLLDVIMDEKIRVGTSTPKADPSGDYAWELFEKADQIKEGSFLTLSEKALQLTGGVDSAKPPEGRNKYGWVMAENQADIFLTYCTNAVLAQKEVEYLKIVAIPEELSVGANYGLLVKNGTSKEAWQLAMYILSSEGQEILREYGFKTTEIEK